MRMKSEKAEQISVANGAASRLADEVVEKPSLDQASDADEIDAEQAEAIGDLGNEDDDPEGWMSERAHYWSDLAKAAHPTRAPMLRHRITECFGLLRALACHKRLDWPTDRTPESEWRRAADEVFGYSADREQRALSGEQDDLGDSAKGSNSEARALRRQARLLHGPAASRVPIDSGFKEPLEWPPRQSHAIRA